MLCRHPDLVFDVEVVAGGPWSSAVRVPTLGGELLEGMTIRSAAVFDSWLLAEQRRLADATNDVLREAVRVLAERGDHRAAIGYAVRRVAITPLDEDCHADLIRLYRAIGDDVAAQRQFATYALMLETELGVRPGPALLAALRMTSEPAA